MKKVVGCALLLMVLSCRPVDETLVVEPIQGFEIKRYLGTWYEIARMPVWFERNLVNVTATYSLREDGTVQVLNQGFVKAPEGKKKQARGKAVFAGIPRWGTSR